MAIEAGGDIALICHELAAAPAALAEIENAPGANLDDSLERLEKARRRLASPTKFSLKKLDEINEDIWKLRVATLGEDGASAPPDAPTQSPVEDY
jgi:beta-N-acetylhexosaminidase